MTPFVVREARLDDIERLARWNETLAIYRHRVYMITSELFQGFKDDSKVVLLLGPHKWIGEYNLLLDIPSEQRFQKAACILIGCHADL